MELLQTADYQRSPSAKMVMEKLFSNPTFIARLQKVRNFLDTVATSIIFIELQIDSLLESF